MKQPMTQKARSEYADYWGLEIYDAYYCDDCQRWTHNDDDDQPTCGC